MYFLGPWVELLAARGDMRICTTDSVVVIAQNFFPAVAQIWKVSGLSRESNYVVANAYSVVVIAQKHTDT